MGCDFGIFDVEASGELRTRFIRVFIGSITVELDADSSVAMEAPLSLVIMFRLMLVVGCLGVDN